MTQDPCSSPEMLSAYLDGKLDVTKRRVIEDHISRCEDCYFVVKETALAETTAPSIPLRLSPGLRRHVLLIAAMIVIAAGSLALWRRAPRVQGPREALVAAVGERRFFDARLTGGFRYGERVGATRGGSPGPIVAPDTANPPAVRGATGAGAEDWEVLAAAARIKKDIGVPATAEDRALLASAHLVLGNSDEAVRLLERAVDGSDATAEAKARLLSDLAAAYLARAANEGRADDFPRALERAAQAVEIDPDLREALYNKALALEFLQLPDEAIKAWDDFLARERDAGWTREAARRRARLANRVKPAFSEMQRRIEGALDGAPEDELDGAVLANVGLARDVFELEILPRVATHAVKARRLADSIQRVTGDGYAVAILNLAAPRELEARARLYAEARRIYDAQRRGEALLPFQEVIRLGRDNDVLSLWARQHLTVLTLGEDPRRAVALSDDLIGLARARSFPILTARLLWIRGIAMDSLRETAGAIASFREAQDLLRAARCFDHAGFMNVQLAEPYWTAGQGPQSWQARIAGLGDSDLLRERSRAFVGVLNAAHAARDTGLPRAARHMLAEVGDEIGSQAGPANTSAIAFRFERALVMSELSAKEALDDLLATEPLIQSLDDPQARAFHQAQFELLVGQLSVPEAGKGARKERVLRALERAQKAHLDSVPRLHLTLARWSVHEGQPAEAVANLEESVAGFERTQAEGGELQRSEAAIVIESVGGALEPVIALAEVPPRRSLLLAERLHALRFGSRLRFKDEDPGQLLDAIPSRAAGLVLLGLKKGVAVWSLSSSGVRLHVIPNKARLLAALADLDAQPPPALEGSLPGRVVSELLLGPLFSELARAETVAIVADEELANLPFAALPRPDTGAAWGSTVEIVSAPTLHFALAGPRSGSRSRHVLALGSPNDGRFAPLPSSRLEVAAIISAYGKGTSLFGPDATLDALEAGLPSATVLHLATHAFLNPNRPESSSIALAGGRDLDVAAIGQLRLQGVDLVTLATCESARTTASPGIGSFEFAGAFLKAGAAQVLASRTTLPDDSPLFLEFHRLLSNGATPRAALTRLRRDSAAARSLLTLYAPLMNPGDPA